jgi:hypothetical protein
MPAPQFYPALNKLISSENVPEPIKSGIDSLFSKLFYKSYYVEKSVYGDTAYHHLVLVFNKVGFNLFGGEDGMEIIFNPGEMAETTEIPISLYYNLPIVKYVRKIKLDDLSSAEEYFNLILEMFNISKNDILFEAIGAFLADNENPIQSFIDDFNNNPEYSSYTPLALGDPSEDFDTDYSIVQSLLEQFEDNNLDVKIYLLQNYIGTINIEEGIENLSLLFKRWMGEFSLQTLIDLFIPKFSVSVDVLELALAFPRKWLKPVDEITLEVIEDENVKAMLIYNVGSVAYNSETGFEFVNPDNFDLTPSQIGNTGIIIEIEDLAFDFKSDSNIPQADADGRSLDFKGIYVETANLILPKKWFKQENGATLKVSGKQLLIGTEGGISGTIALESIVVGNPVGDFDYMWFKLGSDSGFRLGFNMFNISFKQNKVVSSNIKGALEIKKFVYPANTIVNGQNVGGQTVHIDIEGHLSDDGDFNLTASAQPPYPITFPDVFTYRLKSIELGKEDNDFYIGTSGTLQFEGFLRDTLKLGPIEIERLRIYSDGSIEFQGGSVQLIEPIVLPLGPVEITVSAIHYGSHQKEVDGVMRKFNYFGFDGGVKIDPLGIEVRGDGVKYYYCVDEDPILPKPKPYLHIQTLYLDLTIPADSGSLATINGWVTIPEPGISKEYAGGVTLQIPKANLAGKADIKLMPKYPAFLIDCEIEPTVPIPLGSFAIFGFRGLLGYRYVAEKEAVQGFTSDNTWYEYYKAPKLGINVNKFNGPNQSVNYDTLVSLGAGATLGTAADDGYTFSIKAMALFCIPSLFMLDGRANLLAKRLGLDDTVDPPFFAFVAVGDNSLEFGFGANYKLPASGDILTVNAEIQAGFFFKNQKPWYINIGTNVNPITARVLTLLTIKSYVMLSARGIEAGARGEFNFNRNYDVIKVKAHAFIEIGGRVSFERPQIGAYLMAGVKAEVKVLFFTMGLEVGILFGVEAPRPFKIYGKFYFKIKVSIKIFGKRITLFKFSGNLEVVWNFNKNIDLTPINPMIGQSSNANNNLAELVQGVNMLSNEVFFLAYLTSKPTAAPDSAILNHIIPLDTYIDIKTQKGLLPGNQQDPNNSVRKLIGGINNGPSDYEDLIPPVSSIRGKEIRQVKHQYTIDHLEIKFWNTTKNIWEDYHPYEALYPNDLNISQKKIGQFQKTDGKYNAVRILATTPFSYTEHGQPGWYVPEQYGIDATTLFCQSNLREHKCAEFLLKPLNAKYFCGNTNALVYSNNVAFELITPNIEEDYAFISDETNFHNVAKSLAFNNWNSMQILLPEPSKMTELKLSNYTNGVKVKFYAVIQSSLTNPSDIVEYGNPDPNSPNVTEPYELVLFADALQEPIQYNFTINGLGEWEVIHADWNPVSKIVIEPIFDSSISQQIAILNEQIATIENDNNLISLGLIEGEILSTASLEEDLHQLICGSNATSGGSPTSFINRFFKNDKLNYYYSKEFIERESRFIYALGTSENKGLISKIKTDGTLVWERKYDLPEGKEKLVFKRIIQLTGDLEQEERFQYVVYATNGNQHYLMSFNPGDGKVNWTKLIDWKDEDSLVHIAPCNNEFNFYLTLSDRNHIDTNKAPLVAVIDAAGEFVKGTLLAIEKEEFIINAVCEDDNGIVVAGRYVEGDYNDSVGTIIRLDADLKIVDSFQIANQYATIHDVKITDNGKYLLSGYDNKYDGIFVLLIDSEGEFIQHYFPKTKNHNSSIQLCEGGFYLLQNNDDNGRIHRLSLDFDVLWTKEIHLSSGTNGIRNFTFNRETRKLSFNCFNQSEGSLVVYADEILNSCLTTTLDKPVLLAVSVIVKKFAVKEEKYGLKLYPLDLGSKTIDSEIKRYCQYTGCGEEDVIVCELYQQILSIYENCLIVPSLILNENFDSVSLCFEEILNLIKNFDVNYNLPEHLSTQILFINDFLGKKDIRNYTIAWDGVQSILDYLNEIGNCVCDCSSNEFTLIHQVCWMSVQDYDYNINVPSQQAVEEDALATVAGITQYIQPIWRPDTSYYIHFILKDRVSIGNHVNVAPFEFTYGFSTAGPVGFFHNNEKSTYGDIRLKSGDQLLKEDNSYFRVEGNNLMDQNNTIYVTSPDGFVLEDTTGLLRGNEPGSYIFEPGSDPQRKLRVVAHPDKYSLTSLKPYIDYNRSYPNADGNLLSAKPLFFNDYNEVDGGTTKISLFFNKAYATHFFHKWEPYKNATTAINNATETNNGRNGRIKIVIKDPVEDISIINPPYLDYNPEDNVYTHIPQTQEVWSPETNPQVPFAVSQYLNLFNAPNCVGQISIIKPASEYVTIFPKHLKPNKLYTAIVNNLFDVNHNGAFENNASVQEIKEVHKFIFKTSRYKDFEAQIKSYFLKREFEEGLIEREAMFRFEKQFSDDEVNASFVTTKNWSQPETSQLPITGFTPQIIDTLMNDYQHPYDRIFEGILDLKPLDEAISTEVNVIKNSNSGNIIALIVRNPEPFNNPKFNKEVMKDTIEVITNGNVDPSYFVLFSKDNSQAIIMNSLKNITQNVTLRFKYKVYQDALPGDDVVINYPVKSVQELNLDLLNN